MSQMFRHNKLLQNLTGRCIARKRHYKMYYEEFIRTFDKSSLPNVSHDRKAQSYCKLLQKTAKRVELSNCRQISLLISGEYDIWI